MGDTILDVQGLVGGYGKMTILNGTTFSVPSGSIAAPGGLPGSRPLKLSTPAPISRCNWRRGPIPLSSIKLSSRGSDASPLKSPPS